MSAVISSLQIRVPRLRKTVCGRYCLLCTSYLFSLLPQRENTVHSLGFFFREMMCFALENSSLPKATMTVVLPAFPDKLVSQVETAV